MFACGRLPSRPRTSLKENVDLKRSYPRLWKSLRFAWWEARRIARPYTVIGGVRVPIVRSMSLDFRNALYHGNYERAEMAALQATLEPNDVVMEFGTGMGFLSAFAARIVGSERVTTYEANPEMAPLIARTFAINAVHPRSTIALVATSVGTASFHVGERFYDSSAVVGQASSHTLTVRAVSVHEEMRAVAPTYLIMDVEGAERELIPAMDLSGVRKLLIEVHPGLIGEHAVEHIRHTLTEHEFELVATLSIANQWFLRREPSSRHLA